VNRPFCVKLRKLEGLVPLQPYLLGFTAHTLRKRNPYATGLLNCPKSGKNARIVMVEGTVVGQNGYKKSPRPEERRLFCYFLDFFFFPLGVTTLPFSASWDLSGRCMGTVDGQIC
jgi:hypothetical protein